MKKYDHIDFAKDIADVITTNISRHQQDEILLHLIKEVLEKRKRKQSPVAEEKSAKDKDLSDLISIQYIFSNGI